VAEPWAPRRVRRVVMVLAGIYALFVWMDASGLRLPDAILPLPMRFFVQEAALFPDAARDAIEYRAEGWRCDLGRFEEMDVRPFFPIQRDDKESRFYRAMFFHRHQRPVLEALDQFISREQNRAHPEARIGGVMLLSLRIPIPPPGTPEPRYQRLPLADYPVEVQRKYWYVTASRDRAARCEALVDGAGAAAGEGAGAAAGGGSGATPGGGSGATPGGGSGATPGGGSGATRGGGSGATPGEPSGETPGDGTGPTPGGSAP
jgi:hypothetical protein